MAYMPYFKKAFIFAPSFNREPTMTAIARVPEYMFSQKPYFIMYFQILSRSLWGAFLFIVLFSGCKKDNITSAASDTPYWAVTQEQYQQSISSLKSDEDKHFFDFTYASLQNNAVIKTASSRVDSQEILRALAVKLIQLNKQQPFITGVVQRVGYPMWDKSTHLEAENSQTPGVFLPFASLDADSTQGFLVAIPTNNQNWVLDLVDRRDIEDNINEPGAVPNFYFKVKMFYNLDSIIFGKKNKRYADILINQGGLVESTERDCWTFKINNCPMAVNGGATDRGGCIIHYTICSDGTSWMGGGGGSISYGGGGSGGNNGGGGGGGIGSVGSNINPNVAADALFEAFWGKCKAGKIGEDVVGGLVGDDIAACEGIEQINSLGLFSDEQLSTLYRFPSLLQEMTAYLKAHPNDPSAMQIASIIVQQVRQQKITNSQVTQLLKAVNTLGLTAEEVEWLSYNSVHITSIHSFGNQYGTEVDAKQYAKNHLAEMKVDVNYQKAIEATYLFPPILWTIGKELFAEKAVDIIFNLIPGFNKKDEVKDAIKAVASGDWLAFTWEVAKIVAGQVPILKALDAADQLRKLAIIVDKIYDLVGTIGANRLERAWDILKTSTTKFSANALRYVDDVSFPRFGWATSGDWRGNFRNRFPSSDIPDNVFNNMEVHHAVPQAVLTKYPSLGIQNGHMHSVENLRGIPKDALTASGAKVHTTVTNLWTTWYAQNPNATLANIQDYANFIDNLYGHQFIPPVR